MIESPNLRSGSLPVTSPSSSSSSSSSCCCSFVALTYNGLVRSRNRVDNAWSQIDVQLKRRYDLIPNLVETVKGYAAHEQGTFEAVTNARANAINAQEGGNVAQQAQAENVLARCAEEPVRGRRGLPGPQGEPELPAAPGGADLDRGPDRLLAAVLQRQRARLQQHDPDVPAEHRSPGMFNFEKREFFEGAPEETGPVKVQF